MFISVYVFVFTLFFFNQKTAYEMRISDWSSDVCSSDLSCQKGLQERRFAPLRGENQGEGELDARLERPHDATARSEGRRRERLYDRNAETAVDQGTDRRRPARLDLPISPDVGGIEHRIDAQTRHGVISQLYESLVH